MDLSSNFVAGGPSIDRALCYTDVCSLISVLYIRIAMQNKTNFLLLALIIMLE